MTGPWGVPIARERRGPVWPERKSRGTRGRVWCLVVLLLAGACERVPGEPGRAAGTETEQRAQGMTLRLDSLLEPGESAAVLDLASGRIVAESGSDVLKVPRLPGSVFKLVTAAAALAQGLDGLTLTCTGRLHLLGRTWTCWDPRGHGSLRLVKALALSCNLYFYQLASRLDPAAFLTTAHRLGLDGPSGLAVGEQVQELPGGLLQEELLVAALGESEQVRVTGLQLLRLAAVISGVGPLAGNGVALDEVLRQGMQEAASYGTARGAGQGGPCAAKTGTAREPGTWRYHGWCIGYTPVVAPRYAFVVYRYSGVGAEAARTAGRVVEALGRMVGPGRGER